MTYREMRWVRLGERPKFNPSCYASVNHWYTPDGIAYTDEQLVHWDREWNKIVRDAHQNQKPTGSFYSLPYKPKWLLEKWKKETELGFVQGGDGI